LRDIDDGSWSKPPAISAFKPPPDFEHQMQVQSDAIGKPDLKPLPRIRLEKIEGSRLKGVLHERKRKEAKTEQSQINGAYPKTKPIKSTNRLHDLPPLEPFNGGKFAEPEPTPMEVSSNQMKLISPKKPLPSFGNLETASMCGSKFGKRHCQVTSKESVSELDKLLLELDRPRSKTKHIGMKKKVSLQCAPAGSESYLPPPNNSLALNRDTPGSVGAWEEEAAEVVDDPWGDQPVVKPKVPKMRNDTVYRAMKKVEATEELLRQLTCDDEMLENRIAKDFPDSPDGAKEADFCSWEPKVFAENFRQNGAVDYQVIPNPRPLY